MMNELGELREVGDKIYERLNNIRKSIGAPLRHFIATSKDAKIKEVTGEMLAEGEERTPIKFDKEFYLAYIKDNMNREYQGTKSEYDAKMRAKPSGCFTDGKKIHFYRCEVICNMEEAGRDRRYVATRCFSNVQPIDLCDAKNIESRLALCQFCIRDLIENSEVDINYSTSIIAEYGNAQELMHCVKLLDDGDNDAKQKTEEFIERTMRKGEICQNH